MKIALISLGCKVNQYECETLAKKFTELGFETSLTLTESDIYILNTCAVTNEAEKKSRQYVSKINKLTPNAKIYLCGCATQHNFDQFLSKNNIKFIIGNNNKSQIIDAVLNDINGEFVDEVEKNYIEIPESKVENIETAERVRKYLKIQDGCNNFCSYCIIPYLRGRSRSRDLKNVIEEAKTISKYANEIVLTGINLSDYRIDNKLALPQLLNELKNIDARIRLGSLEVNVITEEFLNILKTIPNFAEHFHLSMQSGCNRILKLMNRHYTKEEFLQKCDLIRQYFPFAGISTDLIVGFAKETDSDFEETLKTVEQANFSDMHIFEYSEKEGTKGKLLGKSTQQEIDCRLKKVNNLANTLKDNFIQKNIGVKHKVLIEEKENGYSIGLTGNYIKVYIKSDLEINKFYDIKITKIENEKTIAEIA